MEKLYLQLHLLSDATFGRGDGVAGLVDLEVEHDKYGLPFLRGRTLKGLLVEECANILYVLKMQNQAVEPWHVAAHFLFGRPGSDLDDDGEMLVGDACLPEEIRGAIAYAIEQEKSLTRLDVLEALTTIRRQTAMTADGAPRPGSLRSLRVVLRDMVFESELILHSAPDRHARTLLAACVASLRRVGTGRNRGRGRVKALLSEQSEADRENAQLFTAGLLDSFKQEVA